MLLIKNIRPAQKNHRFGLSLPSLLSENILCKDVHWDRGNGRGGQHGDRHANYSPCVKRHWVCFGWRNNPVGHIRSCWIGRVNWLHPSTDVAQRRLWNDTQRSLIRNCWGEHSVSTWDGLDKNCSDKNPGCDQLIDRITQVFENGDCLDNSLPLEEPPDVERDLVAETSARLNSDFYYQSMSSPANADKMAVPHDNKAGDTVRNAATTCPDAFDVKVDVCAQILETFVIPYSEYNCFPGRTRVCFNKCKRIPNPACWATLGACCVKPFCKFNPICGVARSLYEIVSKGDRYCFKDYSIHDFWNGIKSNFIALAWDTLTGFTATALCSIIEEDICWMYERASALHPEVIALLREIRRVDDTPWDKSWDEVSCRTCGSTRTPILILFTRIGWEVE